MPAPDLSVFDRLKTKRDFDREAEERDYQRVLRNAEMRKAQMLDVDAMGEQAFFKAAQGLPLSPAEEAAARFVDAKSGGTSFNPVTGEVFQKPRISEKIGLGNVNSPMPPMVQPTNMGGQNDLVLPPVGTFATPEEVAKMGNVDDYIPPLDAGALADGGMPPPPISAPKSDLFEKRFNEAMASAAGNPKLQQTIKTDYLKSKITMNESEARNAGFADRMALSNAILSDPKITQESMSLTQRGAGQIPIAGNFLTSKEFKSADQAKRDFINAILRRESGAVIADSEFANADLQYFPQPGDTPEVLAQKAANREAAIQGVKRSAGPAYIAPEVIVPQRQQSAQPLNAPRKGSVVDGYMFNGGDPSNPKSWKKVK
jgi:hypothetical protein